MIFAREREIASSDLDLLGTHDGPLSLTARMAPSLLLAYSFIVLMISIHHYAPEDKKIWSHIGVAFATIYARTGGRKAW